MNHAIYGSAPLALHMREQYIQGRFYYRVAWV